jgi:Tfp pilus assembly protein PilN
MVIYHKQDTHYGFYQFSFFTSMLSIPVDKVPMRMQKSERLFLRLILVSAAVVAAITALPVSYINAAPSDQGREESCFAEHENRGFPPFCFRPGPPIPSCDAFDSQPIIPPGQADDPRPGCRVDPPTSDPPGQQEEEQQQVEEEQQQVEEEEQQVEEEEQQVEEEEQQVEENNNEDDNEVD